MNYKNLRLYGAYSAIFLGLCALIFFRFRDYFPSVFYGDDLAMYMYVHGAESSDPKIAGLLAYIGSAKLRPIFTGLLTVESHLFAKHLGRYLIVNVLINALIGVSAFVVFMQHSRSRVIAVLLAAVLITSRFALYQVTQVTGQVENVSFLLFIWSLAFAWQAVSAEAPADVKRNEWLALLMAALAFHTHERYLVVLPWLLIAFWLMRRDTGALHRRMVFLATVAIVAANALVKHFVLRGAFFEGTGGQKITISFDSIATLASQAAMSVFGLNTGPDYLIGIQWLNLPPEYSAACIGFAIVAALIVISVLVWSERIGRALIPFPWLLVLLAAMLAAPASMTIRMEQRWELAPFFILLVLVSCWVGNHQGKKWALAVVGLLACCQFAIEQGVSDSFKNISFIYEAAYARAVKTSIIDSGATPRGQSVVLVAESSHCSWAILEGRGLFDFYEGAGRTAVCVSDANAARAIAHGRPIFTTESWTKLVRIGH